jgi:hypothetical protein
MKLSVMDPSRSCRSVYVTTRKSVNLKDINMTTNPKCLWMVSPQLTNFTITSGGDTHLFIHHPVNNYRSELKNVGPEERYESTSLLLRWEISGFNVSVARDEISEDSFVNSLELSCAPYTSNSIELEVISNGTVNEDIPRYTPTPAPKPTSTPTPDPDEGIDEEDEGMATWAVLLIVFGSIIAAIVILLFVSAFNCRDGTCRFEWEICCHISC